MRWGQPLPVLHKIVAMVRECAGVAGNEGVAKT